MRNAAPFASNVPQNTTLDAFWAMSMKRGLYTRVAEPLHLVLGLFGRYVGDSDGLQAGLYDLIERGVHAVILPQLQGLSMLNGSGDV